MKVTLPEKVKINKKQWIIYISIMIICIICVIIAFYVQFYARVDIGKLIGINTQEGLNNKTQEEVEALETGFDQIFTNTLNMLNDEGNDKKEDSSKLLVYTDFEKKENKLNSYDIEVHIPKININSEVINKYNEDIDAFMQKTNEILESENRNIIYTVDYVANIKDGILSLMIMSNLKEGTSAQRVIVETYNYDLRNNKEISLQEVLDIENIENEEVKNKINEKIELEQRKVEDLKNLGYNIYNRDTESDIYKIENIQQFYLDNNTLYIIFAYGNENFTSEMDLVIL